MPPRRRDNMCDEGLGAFMAKRGVVAERSDAVLIERTRKGDSGAYGELWNRHAGAVKVLAARLDTGGQTDAVLTEAFKVALANIRSGAGPTGPLRPYLFAIVRQVGSTWTTRGDEPPRAADPVNEWEITEDLTVQAVNNVPTMQAFRTLSPRQQEILWYCEVEEMSAASVAPLLGVHESNVPILIHRAREALRAAWIVSQPQVTGPDASEHQWVRGHLATYLSDDLKPGAQERVGAHLRSCTECSLVSDEAAGLPQQLAGVILPVVAGASAGMWYEAWVHAGGVAAAPGIVPPEVMSAASTVLSAGGTSTLQPTGITTATATVLGATTPGAAEPASPAVARPAPSAAGSDPAVSEQAGSEQAGGLAAPDRAAAGVGAAADGSDHAVLVAKPGVAGAARPPVVNTMRTMLGLAPSPVASVPVQPMPVPVTPPVVPERVSVIGAASIADTAPIGDVGSILAAAPVVERVSVAAAASVPVAAPVPGASRAADVAPAPAAVPASAAQLVLSADAGVSADAAVSTEPVSSADDIPAGPVADGANSTLPVSQVAGPGPIGQDFGSKTGTRRFKAAYFAVGMVGVLAVEAIVVGLFLVNPTRDDAAVPDPSSSVIAAPPENSQEPGQSGDGATPDGEPGPSGEPGSNAEATADPSASPSNSATPTVSPSTTPTPSSSATTPSDARPAAANSPRPAPVNPPTSLALAGIDAGATGLMYPSVAGVAKPGSVVTVEGGPNGSVVVQADAAGNWATGPLAGLAPGTTHVLVSSASEAGTVAVPVAAPPSLSYTPTFSGLYVSISGLGGAQVELYADGQAGSWSNITLNGAGQYSTWLHWPVSGGHTLAARYVEDGRAGPMLTQSISLPGTTADPAGDGPLVAQ